jgi:hypothetical protein
MMKMTFLLMLGSELVVFVVGVIDDLSGYAGII